MNGRMLYPAAEKGKLEKGERMKKEENNVNESIKVTRWHFMQYEVSLKSTFTEMYFTR